MKRFAGAQKKLRNSYFYFLFVSKQAVHPVYDFLSHLLNRRASRHGSPLSQTGIHRYIVAKVADELRSNTSSLIFPSSRALYYYF